MTVAVCGAANLDGYTARCTQPARHHGPHSAPGGGPGIIGLAWCTPPTPCQGRTCQGPCHPDDPNAKGVS